MTDANTERSTKLETALVAVLCIVPAVAAIAYGGVDAWMLGLLAILVTIVAILWVVDAWVRGEFRFNSNPIQLPLVGLIALGLVQLLPVAADPASGLLSTEAVRTLSIDPYATRFFLEKLLLLSIFFGAALTFLNGSHRVSRVATAIIIFGSGLAFFGILQRLATPEAIYGLRPTPQAIPFGPFVNQHHFAALMEMCSGLALAMVFGGGLRRERKLLIGIAAGVMGMAIVFTGSRGGLFSYLAVLAFVVVASFARARGNRSEPSVGRRNLVVAGAAFGLVLLVIGSVLLLGGEASLLRGVGLQENPGDPTSGRAHFWTIAWRIFLDNPLIGAGLDGFGVAFPRYDTWSGMFRVEQAHNDYLQMLADGGLFGFACVVAFLVLFVRQGMSALANRTMDLDRSIVVGAFAGCFGILVHSFFDFPLRTPANSFFFLLLAALALRTAGDKGRVTSDK